MYFCANIVVKATTVKLSNPTIIETAVVVGELYRYNGEWKFNAIGSGFQGGLAALCGHYGIEVA